MRRTGLAFIGVICITLLSAFLERAQATGRPGNAEAALRSLRNAAGNDLRIEWNAELGTPSVVIGRLSPPSRHTPAWLARTFLTRYKALYGIRDANRELDVERAETHPGGATVFVRHLLFRTPVWEDGLVVELDGDGVIRSVSGTIHPDLEKKLAFRDMKPAYSARDAVGRAMAAAGGQPAEAPSATRYYMASRTGTPLVYAVRLRFADPNRAETLLVHSLTGRVIWRQPAATSTQPESTSGASSGTE